MNNIKSVGKVKEMKSTVEKINVRTVGKVAILIFPLFIGLSMASGQPIVPAIQTTLPDQTTLPVKNTTISAQPPLNKPVSQSVSQRAIVTSQTQIMSPPPINIISGYQSPMNTKEKQGVRLADEWKSNQALPTRGVDGSVLFLYGATLPSVVCAPLYACNLKLQSGETVTQIDVADNIRWKVTPSTYGNGSNTTTVLVIKPTDSGLQTDMTISTDRRMYVVKLLSRMTDWMPLVSFAYPEDVSAAWAAYYAKKKKQREETIIPSTGQNIAKLNFGFRMGGDDPLWKPTRIYTDGSKTYIQFPPAVRSDEAPALVVLGSGNKEQLVNYRMVGDAYVVDRVLQRAALISGVGGDQVRVTITRDGSVY